MGQAAQALVQEVLAGENGQPLGGTAKAQRVEQVGRVAGTMDLATRGAPTTVTPGAITLTKMTGPIPGLMHPNRSRAGVPVVETEVNPGVMVEMEPEQGAATTGGSPKKVPTHRAGTTTATGQALDVGTRQAEPTPAAAATPGQGVEDQIIQTRALRTRAPTGPTNPILRVTARAGVSQ